MARPSSVSVSRMMLRLPTAVSPANVTMIVGECCGRIGSILTTVAPSSTKTRPHAGPATTLHRSITVKPASGAFVATPGSVGRRLRVGVMRVGKASARRQDSSAGYGCALAIQADRPICGAALPRTSAKMPAACAFGSRFHSSQL